MLIEFEPAQISADDTRIILAALLIVQPEAFRDFAQEAIDFAAPVTSAGEHKPLALHVPEKTAQEVFADTAPAPAPIPDPAVVFAQQPGPLAVGDAPIAAAPGGSVISQALAAASALSPIVSAELDSKGQPWDPTVHTSTKAKVKDGTWRKQRTSPNAPPAAASPASSASAIPAPPVSPAPAASIPSPPAEPSPPGAGPTPQAAALGEALAAATPVVAGGRPTDFMGIMKMLSGYQAAGKVTGADINTCLTGIGVDSLPTLRNRPDLFPSFVDLLESYAGS